MPKESVSFRERILRDSFTVAEQMVFWLVLIACILVFTFANPASDWIRGILIITGILSLFVVKIHENTHPFFVDLLWQRFWLLTAPAWLLTLQFLIGCLEPSVEIIEIQGETWITVREVPHWRPTSFSNLDNWTHVFTYLALYLLALLLFIIPKSRAFFERVLPLLCLVASFVALFGFAQSTFGTDTSSTSGYNDSFALFPYDGHWGAFAMLWCAVSLALSLHPAFTQVKESYLNTRGPWFLSSAIILGFSGLWIESRWPAAILLFSFACLLIIFSAYFLRTSKDPDRILIGGGASFFSIAALLASFYQYTRPDIMTEPAGALKDAGIRLFSENPFFGWGINAYSELLPFYANGTLLLDHYERAHSDSIQYLAELGIFGIGLIAVLIIWLFLRYLRSKNKLILSNYLLFGCASVLCLAFVDTPFFSPAVFFSFWIVLFSAFRWTDLNREGVDQVDAKVIVVSNESERKVPVYEGNYREPMK